MNRYHDASFITKGKRIQTKQKKSTYHVSKETARRQESVNVHHAELYRNLGLSMRLGSELVKGSQCIF